MVGEYYEQNWINPLLVLDERLDWIRAPIKEGFPTIFTHKTNINIYVIYLLTMTILSNWIVNIDEHN